MSAEPSPTPERTPQARSVETRAKLMEAAIACLAQYGWAGTTTTLVSERAGVSRGAQLHHFRTRGELIAAAVEHMAEVRLNEQLAETGRLGAGRLTTERLLEVLAGFYTGPTFTAALELWVAARTDDELRAYVAPLEDKIGRMAHQLCVEALGVDEDVPGVRETIEGTLDLIRGLGLADAFGDDAARRQRVLHQWARNLDIVLPEART